MLLSSEETLAVHRQENAELIRLAQQERLARHLARMRRARRWARRLERLSARLDQLARSHRARLS